MLGAVHVLTPKDFAASAYKACLTLFFSVGSFLFRSVHADAFGTDQRRNGEGGLGNGAGGKDLFYGEIKIPAGQTIATWAAGDGKNFYMPGGECTLDDMEVYLLGQEGGRDTWPAATTCTCISKSGRWEYV